MSPATQVVTIAESDALIHYGKKLKDFLDSKRIPTSEFMQICRLSRQSAYNYFGRERFSYSQAKAVTSALGLPLSFLGISETNPIEHLLSRNVTLFTKDDVPKDSDQESEDSYQMRFITQYFFKLYSEISSAKDSICIVNFLPEEKKFRVSPSNKVEKHFFDSYDAYLDRLFVFLDKNSKVKYTRLYEIDQEPQLANSVAILQTRAVECMMKCHIRHLIDIESSGRDIEILWTPLPIFKFSGVIIDSTKIITRLDRCSGVNGFSFPHWLKIETAMNDKEDPIKQTLNDFSLEIAKLRRNRLVYDFSLSTIRGALNNLDNILKIKSELIDSRIASLNENNFNRSTIELDYLSDERKKIKVDEIDLNDKTNLLRNYYQSKLTNLK